MKSLATLLLLAILATFRLGSQQSYDILIVGARVLDGTGNPWFYADIGIRGDRIVAVGDLKGSSAVRAIEAHGKIVAPGFIDLHSHADEGLGSEDSRRRAAPNLVSQGVTTVVVNQDGRSPWPISDQRFKFDRQKIGPNALLMAGHGAVRRRVMGNDFRRAATDEEIQRMRGLTRQAMQEGAYGLSAGLEYIPGRWSTTPEVIALVKEIVPFGGVYISHERSEGSDPMWFWPSQDPPGAPNLLDAVRETITIGRETGGTVVASHIKAKGAHYWGSGHAAIQLIEKARSEGVDVWADQYPYDTTGSDGRTVLIPDWVFDRSDSDEENRGKRDFAARLRQVLADSRSASNLRRDIEHEISRRGEADRIVIFEYPDQKLIGKSLAEIAAARSVSPVEAAIALQLEGFADRPGGARIRGFSLSEVDIEALGAQPWTATSSDAGIALPEDGPVHPRYYGTFVRKIRRYALERRVILLENAVRAATSLPAQILKLPDRGMIRAGFYADLLIFEQERIRDRATAFEPHQYAEGIHYVLINGQFVLDSGRLTGSLAGRVIVPIR